MWRKRPERPRLDAFADIEILRPIVRGKRRAQFAVDLSSMSHRNFDISGFRAEKSLLFSLFVQSHDRNRNDCTRPTTIYAFRDIYIQERRPVKYWPRPNESPGPAPRTRNVLFAPGDRVNRVVGRHFSPVKSPRLIGGRCRMPATDTTTVLKGFRADERKRGKKCTKKKEKKKWTSKPGRGHGRRCCY